MRHATSLLLAATLGVSVAPAALGAQPAGERPATYGEAVDVAVVNVDVYVNDASGNPVTGLTREDFVLLEGKKRLAIDYFYASEAPSAGGSPERTEAAGEAPAVEWSRTDAVVREPPHVVVFVDNANISPGSRNRVLGRLRGFVDRAIAEGARLMVVTNDGSPNIRLPFTDDPEAIAASLEQLEGLAILGFNRLAERRAILASIEQLDQSMFQIRADEAAQQGAQVGLRQPGRRETFHPFDPLRRVQLLERVNQGQRGQPLIEVRSQRLAGSIFIAFQIQKIVGDLERYAQVPPVAFEPQASRGVGAGRGRSEVAAASA